MVGLVAVFDHKHAEEQENACHLADTGAAKEEGGNTKVVEFAHKGPDKNQRFYRHA